MEEKLRAKYTLIDKNDPSSIAAAQAAGLPVGEDGELVGESDGSSFGVGPAPPGSITDKSSVITTRKKEAKRGKASQRSM